MGKELPKIVGKLNETIEDLKKYKNLDNAVVELISIKEELDKVKNKFDKQELES